MIYNFAPILFFNKDQMKDQKNPFHKQRLKKMFFDYNIKNYTEIQLPLLNEIQYTPSKFTTAPRSQDKITTQDYYLTISHLLCMRHFIKHVSSSHCFIFENDVMLEENEYTKNKQNHTEDLLSPRL